MRAVHCHCHPAFIPSAPVRWCPFPGSAPLQKVAAAAPALSPAASTRPRRLTRPCTALEAHHVTSPYAPAHGSGAGVKVIKYPRTGKRGAPQV